MHGRIKVRTTAEQEAIKKKERAEKLKKFKAYMGIVFQKRQEKDYTEEIFVLTERILLQNSDIYTLWNIRREAFMNNNWDVQIMEENLKKELTLTENCLRENPKSYYVWHHRSWAMHQMNEPNWKHELMLCAKCLNLDERNFHCWDYRQFVVKKAGISNAEEFDFSTTKILSNFSNYSSWHYRSLILSNIFQNDADEQKINDKKEKELELVMNATFTDPGDSSAWFYQRWLLDSSDIVRNLCRALIKDNTVILSFDKAVNAHASIHIYLDGKEKDIAWNQIHQTKYGNLWIAQLTEQPEYLQKVKEVKIIVEKKSYTLSLNASNNTWIYKAPIHENNQPHNTEQLHQQLLSYNQLCDLEPKNKWAFLTSVLLMTKINATEFHDDILSKLNHLLQIDPFRLKYYQDLRSRYVVEHALHKLWKEESDLEMLSVIDLSGLSLTTLREEQHLAFFEEVNLGGNFLGKSLYQLVNLCSCEKLSLASNRLENLKTFPKLPNLRYLSLRNNNLAKPEDIVSFVKKQNLSKLDIRDNPVCTDATLLSRISELDKNVELCVN